MHKSTHAHVHNVCNVLNTSADMTSLFSRLSLCSKLVGALDRGDAAGERRQLGHRAASRTRARRRRRRELREESAFGLRNDDLECLLVFSWPFR